MVLEVGYRSETMLVLLKIPSCSCQRGGTSYPDATVIHSVTEGHAKMCWENEQSPFGIWQKGSIPRLPRHMSESNPTVT